MVSSHVLQFAGLGNAEPPLNASGLIEAGNTKADKIDSCDDIKLRDSPIFAAGDC